MFLRLRFSLLLLHADLRRNSRLFRDEAEDFFIQPSPTEAESRIGLEQPKQDRLRPTRVPGWCSLECDLDVRNPRDCVGLIDLSSTVEDGQEEWVRDSLLQPRSKFHVTLHRTKGIRVLNSGGPVVDCNCLREVNAVVSSDCIDDAQDWGKVGPCRGLPRCKPGGDTFNGVSRPKVS